MPGSTYGFYLLPYRPSDFLALLSLTAKQMVKDPHRISKVLIVTILVPGAVFRYRPKTLYISLTNRRFPTP